jgi:Probable transposase
MELGLTLHLGWPPRPRKQRHPNSNAVNLMPTRPLPLTGEETGIDLGLESFATRADGSQIANPRILRVAELNLKRAQRRVARRQKGSHRRRKAVVLLAMTCTPLEALFQTWGTQIRCSYGGCARSARPRRRKSGKLARPYSCRLSIVSRLI